MSELTIFSESDAEHVLFHSNDTALVRSQLVAVGIRFEQWKTVSSVAAGEEASKVIAAYRSQVDELVAAEGYQCVDVVSLDASDPETLAKVPELRAKFLSEHTHSEDEVRFFVAGRGLFTLHLQTKVYEVLCEKGDLISVPAGTPHWFDMGAKPAFVAIRFFNNPEGWVAHYTGASIAESFSRLELES